MDPKLTRRFSRKSLQSKPGEPPPSPLLRVEPELLRKESKRWLCGHMLPAVPLGHGAITLGRHKACSIVLPHVSISRRHAEIKARGQVVVFADLGSRNGSMVNGERVHEKAVALHPKARILLGPYLFEIRAARPTGPAPSRIPALSGSIEEGALLEVIQGIDLRKKTCTLQVMSEGTKGFLSVRDGAPLKASWGSATNEDAVIQMLALSAGEFALMNDAPKKAPTEFKSTLRSLLFRALKNLDEGFHSHDTQRF